MESERHGIRRELASMTGIFWTANWMELVERFAYFGVRVIVPLFMVVPISAGGPGFDHRQKGALYATWALVQSFVPIFTGGFADRYGYRLNIAISTALKIVGYLIMGYAIPLSEILSGAPLSETRPLGTDLCYETFFFGAMFLALGTAIFKPGVQGLIAHQLRASNSSLGWSVFYQVVNIGGFLGPLLAAYLRVLKYEYVFVTCAAAIALNFVPLFFFRDPESDGDAPAQGFLRTLQEAIHGLLEPRLFFFTMSFAGFWLMFFQLFDILPNFIDDWIDSRGIATALSSVLGDLVPTVRGGHLTQEWMINANACLISGFAFLFGHYTGKIRALVAIAIGILISTAAIMGFAASMSGWWVLACIALFSVGEMTASPTKHRYLSSIAHRASRGSTWAIST